MSLGPLMIGVSGEVLTPEEREWLAHPAIGGVILFARNFSEHAQLCALVADIHSIRTPRLLVAVDQEGGRVQRLREPFTRLPPMHSVGAECATDATFAHTCATDIGWLIGAELLACGIDLSFTPVVDLDRGVSEVIGNRAFHADPELAATLALAHMRGLREAGMAATAKHFPTHAGAIADSHEALAVDRRDYSELYDDLEPYRRLIADGLPSVMVGHVVFPQLDELPASLSRWWIEDQLRSQLRFSGAVLSDDLGMGGVGEHGSMLNRMQLALAAGCDMALVCNELEVIPELLNALSSYSNPSAQLRLMRLRGEASMSWDELRSSARWRAARDSIEKLTAAPPLELEG